MLVVLLGPLALFVTLNNLSSGIIICGIAFVMMFVACKRKWPFILVVAALIVVVVFAPPVAIAMEKAGILHSYQLSRILVWKNPEAYPKSGGYQVLQGLYAIGSGGLLGKGLGQSIQKLSFLPEPQNDMIFAVICEELVLTIGNLSIDRVAHKAFYREQDLCLANREYEVLLYLAEHPDRDITFEELGTALFGVYRESDRRSVMVNVSRLRKRFEGNYELENRIETVWSKGYRFLKGGI